MNFFIHRLLRVLVLVTTVSCFLLDAMETQFLTAEHLAQFPKELLMEKAKLSLEATFQYNFALEKGIKALSPVYSVALSPDGSKILAGHEKGGTAVLLDRKTGDVLHTFKVAETGSVTVSFSLDGSLLVTDSYNFDKKELALQVWSIKNLSSPVFSLKGDFLFNSMGISPDNKYMAASSEPGTIDLWEIESGKKIKTLHTAAKTKFTIIAIDFSLNGDTMYAGTEDGKLYSIDLGLGLRPAINLYDGLVESITLSPDKTKAFVGLRKGTAHIVNIHPRKVISTLRGHTNYIQEAIFSTDGTTVVTSSSDGTVRLWDTKSGKQLLQLDVIKGYFAPVAMSGNGNTIVTTDKGQIFVWSRVSGGTQGFGFAEEKKIKNETPIENGTLSPDGNYVLIGQEDGKAVLWDRKTGGKLKTFAGGNNGFVRVRFSRDGLFIVTTAYDAEAKESILRVWSIDNSTIPLLDLKGSSFNSPVFSPDNKYIVAGSDKGKIDLWEIASGNKIKTFDIGAASKFPFYSVRFSLDGTVILAGAEDGKLYVFDIHTGAKKSVMQLYNGIVDTFVISFDGKKAITGLKKGQGHVWDTQTGKLLATLKGHTGCLHGASFSANSALALTGSCDGTIRLWDAKSGKELLLLKIEGKPINSVALSEDGNTIVATALEDIVIWSRPSVPYGTEEWKETRKAAAQETFMKKLGPIFSQASEQR